MLEIVQAESDADIQAVRELIRELVSWSRSALPGPDQTPPTFQGLDEELAGLPGIFAPPAGRLLLARLDGQAAGCIAFRPHGPGRCELKRMYVRPAFRGHRIGWHLAERVVEEARLEGYRCMMLDSHRAMVQAHRIYEGLGFKMVTTPEEFPEVHKEYVVFMENDLVSGGCSRD